MSHRIVARAVRRCRRQLSTQSPAAGPFDRDVKLRQRNAAFRGSNRAAFEYVRDTIAKDLVERLPAITRKLDTVLDLGCNSGNIRRCLTGREGISTLHMCDTSEVALGLATKADAEQRIDGLTCVPTLIDNEETLPYAAATFDAVVSSCALHWVNNVSGALEEVRRVLRPDGVFICSFVGGSTLTELRQAMLAAEIEREGGVSVHTSPMPEPATFAALLSGVGFAMPTVDVDTHTLEYEDAFQLMAYLQGMGDGNAAAQRRHAVPRGTFLAAAAVYSALAPCDNGKGIVATMEVINAIAWAPSESQPKPLKRGSAKHSFKDLPNLKKDVTPGE